MAVFNIFKRDDAPINNGNTELSDINYLERVLQGWLDSPVRDEQLLAEKYYDGDHDILRREKKVIGADGKLTTIDNVINNKLIDNQYRKLVDQKTNYVLGKPLTIATEKDEYLTELDKIFDKKNHRKLRLLAQYSIDGGIAWMYPHYSEDGEFAITVFPSYEICPVWKDKAHTELECAMRYYDEIVYLENGNQTKVTYVDLYTTQGITHFRYQGASLILQNGNEHTDYIYVGENGYNWTKLPIIPFKYNAKEIPLIRNVKSLQDALNEAMSDFQNNMQEDPRSSILIIKNYDGENLATFRQNLATYGICKVTTVDGVQGGVETLKVDVNAQNYQANLMQLKRALIENGRGFDAKEERMDGDPNQMNIESMYTDIDLDVNGMETEFQSGFEELKWFIDNYLITKGVGDFTQEKVEFVFNRDIFINEDSKILNCVQSKGIISDKTIIARHPWVTDLQHELAQIEEEQQKALEQEKAELEIMNAFEKPSVGGEE